MNLLDLVQSASFGPVLDCATACPSSEQPHPTPSKLSLGCPLGLAAGVPIFLYSVRNIARLLIAVWGSGNLLWCLEEESIAGGT